VIDTVKRASGIDFKVAHAPRRPGDPAQIVADATRARAVLGWKPRLDDLATIIDHAFRWERKLMTRNA
jgi:UDP-glucose 4-epimerase